MHIEQLQISQLKPATYNPRTISKDEFKGLKASLKKYGLVEPIIVNKDYTIIGGHMRVKAWTELGNTTAPCYVLDLDKHNEKKLNVLLNSQQISGQYDDLKLEEILQDLKLDEDYHELRLNKLATLDLSETTEDDFIQPKEAKYKVELGDIYQLGEHRLMCGDSCELNDVERLMDGKKANMVFTDPPYGVSYQSHARKKSPRFAVLKNDDTIIDGWIDLLSIVSEGFVFVWTTFRVLDIWIKSCNVLGDLTNMIIWNKGGGGIGDLTGAYSVDYEIALVYNRGVKLKGKRIGSVWDVGRDQVSSYQHPTQKPIGLANIAIETTTSGGDIVLDLFGGSGSTLIACENTKRKCYAMELDPYYCSVIIERWEKLTNETHKKINAT